MRKAMRRELSSLRSRDIARVGMKARKTLQAGGEGGGIIGGEQGNSHQWKSCSATA